jgi:hypothetical protein
LCPANRGLAVRDRGDQGRNKCNSHEEDGSRFRGSEPPRVARVGRSDQKVAHPSAALRSYCVRGLQARASSVVARGVDQVEQRR